MFRWQTSTGVVLGLACGLALLRVSVSGRFPPPAGPILSECDGHLRDLVIHYEPGAREIVAAAYRDFMGALEPDITVHVVCPTVPAAEELRALVGPVRCRLQPLVVGHAMTTWSRDRWVALAPGSANGAVTLLSPHGEASEEIWPARAGDERIGSDIARALAPRVFARRSQLYFDGGDFLADNETVFVVPRLLQRNIQRTVQSREELLARLGSELRQRVVLLNSAPEHHAGMFMVSAGNRTMLVGDPSLGRQCAETSGGAWLDALDLPGGPDFSPETQQLFDAVAEQCAQDGYRAIRVPTIPAGDGRSYLTCVNVLLDQQGKRRIVYLPFYRGAEPFNRAARAVWEGLGFEVRLVDCTRTYRHFGCLHCLVNVLRRS